MKTPISNIKNNQGIVLIIALIFLFITTLLGISAMRSSLLNEKMAQSSIQREQAFEAAEAALLAGEEFVDTNAMAIVDSVVTIGSASTPNTISAAAQNCEADGGGGLNILGVSVNGGICAPVEVWDTNAGTATGMFDNWRDIDGDSRSLEVWDNGNRHINLNNVLRDQYNLITAPRYIIEFMGYVGSANNNGDTACTSPGDLFQLDSWPYCTLDPAQFRITAFATSGNQDETQVMLQSTYVVN